MERPGSTRVLQAKDTELQHFKSKKYEEREHTGFCYVIKTDGGIKVRKTKDVGKRVKGLQTANVGELRILLAFPTCEPDIVERNVHLFLHCYRSNAKREFFDCDAEYIKTVVKLTGNFVNTMGSAYQAITEDELLSKLGERLCFKGILPPPPPVLICDVFKRFLDEKTVPVPKDDKDAWIQPSHFFAHFKSWCQERNYPKKDGLGKDYYKAFKDRGMDIERRNNRKQSAQWIVGWKLTM
ncbi:hypothetical protein HK102_002466 [Quaeritorhiza haematococci]|nr:hypothetical protein HK102_002466 [Quaeritorhiza haematococci]